MLHFCSHRQLLSLVGEPCHVTMERFTAIHDGMLTDARLAKTGSRFLTSIISTKLHSSYEALI